MYLVREKICRIFFRIFLTNFVFEHLPRVRKIFFKCFYCNLCPTCASQWKLQWFDKSQNILYASSILYPVARCWPDDNFQYQKFKVRRKTTPLYGHPPVSFSKPYTFDNKFWAISPQWNTGLTQYVAKLFLHFRKTKNQRYMFFYSQHFYKYYQADIWLEITKFSSIKSIQKKNKHSKLNGRLDE